MEGFRVLEIKKSVFENNDREADKLREELKKEKTFLLNLMSSPGSGKTTTLKATIAALKDEMRIGVMEADIDSDVDAATIEKTGAKVIQLHTGGMCHLDAEMTRQGLDNLSMGEIDLVILFNDPTDPGYVERVSYISNLCDQHSVPFASNVATAEMLILGLSRGDLDWRDIMYPKTKPFTA